MTAECRYDRRQLHPLLARCWVALVVAFCVLAGSSTAEASIVAPAPPEFSLEPSSGGTGTTHSCYTGTSSGPQGSEAPAKERALSMLMAQPGPSSTTSTSGSSSLAGASVTAALAYFPASILCDPAVAGWVSGEGQVALPSPPGNELLRPPQMEV
jgi:hypothetical protein